MNQNLMRAGVRLVADRIMIFCSRSYLQGMGASVHTGVSLTLKLDAGIS